MNSSLSIPIGRGLLIAIAFGAPLAPFWYFEALTTTRFSIAQIGIAVISGSVILLCEIYSLERYTGTSAKGIALIDGFFLGLNAGVLSGEWIGLSQDFSFFTGLAGALIFTYSFLDVYERFI